MLIALLVVVYSFRTIGRIPLVYMSFGKLVFELLLERKREECFTLRQLCQFSRPNARSTGGERTSSKISSTLVCGIP